jgi:fatty acid desaturase
MQQQTERRPMVETARPTADDPTLAVLRSQLRDAGLLRRRPLRAWARIAITLALVALGWAAFVVVGNSWWTLAVAIWLAVMFTQVGFVGHDIGHRQVAASHRVGRFLGILHADFLIGISYAFWLEKHNAHHAHPNQDGLDPDISPGAIAWTPEQANLASPARRALARAQAELFFPMLLLEAGNLHAKSLVAIWRRPSRRQALEAVVMTAHFVGYLLAVFLVLSPAKALAFIAVQQGLFGLYLGCSFAPNHKGMPVLPEDSTESFLRRQTVTARNVKGGWFVDLALGGLNYQIEHHLFPAMPRANLRRAQPIVKAFCERHHLAYEETSLASSWRAALASLRRTGRGLPSPAGAG